VARERNERNDPQVGVPTAILVYRFERYFMDVVIGIDPHKASHTAVALGAGEVEAAS
jgi:hypothetical protein